MSYTSILRRIREKKTNYRKRKALLIGKHNFVVPRVSNQNVQIQVSKAEKNGDKIIASAHSKELLKHGWKGSRKSIPACYLTGLLVGKKAVAKNIKECVLYTGRRIYSPRIAACVKGMLDAGLNIPVEEETLPKKDMLSGNHIADYAKDLKQNDNQLYKSRFSAVINEGFVPEDYAELVTKTKSSILGKPAVKEVEEKVEPPAKEEKTKEPKSRRRAEKKTIRKKSAKKGDTS